MTMKIKSSHPETQGPFVIINADDFDPATMEEYGEEPTVQKGRRGNR